MMGLLTYKAMREDDPQFAAVQIKTWETVGTSPLHFIFDFVEEVPEAA